MNLESLLQSKNASEKAQELAKVAFRGQYQRTIQGVTIKVEIQDIQEIDGGITVYARAWKNGKQVGFGKDGSVEIERFNIYNPPVLVEDPNGDIIRESTDAVTGEVSVRKLREDHEEAIKQVIADNVRIVGKENTQIVKGKVGRTTSTFYPNASPESTSVDGRAGRDTNTGETWTATRTGSGTISDDNTTQNDHAQIFASGSRRLFYRGHFIFDTSAIPDGDTIDSGTISFYDDGTRVDGATGGGLALVESTSASNTSIVNSDYSNYNTTRLADTDIDYTSHTLNAYADMTLNSSGLSNISKTSVSKFATINSLDLDNSDPGGSYNSAFSGYFADQTGTTQDPKLVVVHSAATRRIFNIS